MLARRSPIAATEARDGPPLRRRVAIRGMRSVTRALAALGLRDAVLRRRLERARRRRRVAELAGSDHLSRPALHDIDRTLDRLIDRDGGFFVEAGANDGFTQSNTYWLERFRGWRGVLVEPMEELAREAAAERPDAHVVRCALVPHDHPEPTVTMRFGDLMSVVADTREAGWSAPGVALGWRDPYEAAVPARTLTAVLDEVRPEEIDLLSLDVEGYEESVLRGLDLERYAPRWILVEAHDPERGRVAIEGVLGERYALHGQISPLDLLFRRADVAPAQGSASPARIA